MLEAILVKQTEISKRPVKLEMDADAVHRATNMDLETRLRNVVLIIVDKLVKKEEEFDYNLFILTLQNLCIQVTCTSIKVLKTIFAKLECLMTKDTLHNLFRVHADRMNEQFLRRRTGILSPDLMVRRLAINILICLGWAGQLDKMLPHMEPIFNYKPIQMLDKMETLLKQEFDRISHYELLFYSEMSKDLLQIFKEKDAECQVKALRTPDTAGTVEEEPVEEAKDEAPKVEASLDDSKPVDLAALMKKKAKKTKDKKAKKAKKGGAPAKPAPTKVAEAPADDGPEISKEE